jgi:phospholipase/lecithinase/hemolysin
MKMKWIGLFLCVSMAAAVAKSPDVLSSRTPLQHAESRHGAVKQIVVFGDSLSDTGNLYEYMRHQLPMSPPYYEGRFSNGPVWIEHLAEHYFPTHAKAYVSNYAFGGAGVGSEEEAEDDDVNDGAMLNLDAEINSYLLAHDDKADPSSLYVVWMGSNNYLSLPENLDDELEFTIGGIRRALDTLVLKGAKHIMLVGVPDLGKIPMAREFEYTKELSYLSSQHNLKLEEEVETRRVQNPDVQWILYQVDILLTNALEYPAYYGFKNVTGTCHDTEEYLPASSPSVLNMVSRVKTRLRTADICDAYLFFDPVHPSGRSHQYIAEWGIKALNEAGVRFEPGKKEV